MNNAPDTRNKLDNNKQLTKKKKVNPNINKKTAFSSLKKELNLSKKPLLVSNKKEPSKGYLYKQVKGHSKTQKRLMKIYSTDLEGLKKRTILRKDNEKAIKHEKHKKSLAYKRANSKSKSSKGSKPASKTSSK